MSSTVLRDKIVAFLMGKRGRPFCNDCISEKQSTSVDEVRLETETMKIHSAFVQAITICMGCRRRQSAIRARQMDEPAEGGMNRYARCRPQNAPAGFPESLAG
jgi:hypothetical protein